MNPSFLKVVKEEGAIKFSVMPICPYSPFEPNLEDILKKPSLKQGTFLVVMIMEETSLQGLSTVLKTHFLLVLCQFSSQDLLEF